MEAQRGQVTTKVTQLIQGRVRVWTQACLILTSRTCNYKQPFGRVKVDPHIWHNRQFLRGNLSFEILPYLKWPWEAEHCGGNGWACAMHIQSSLCSPPLYNRFSFIRFSLPQYKSLPRKEKQLAGLRWETDQIKPGTPTAIRKAPSEDPGGFAPVQSLKSNNFINHDLKSQYFWT